jgi:hypothetical protein
MTRLCLYDMEDKHKRLLRTPTLRSGGLKLSYMSYGKCGYIIYEITKPASLRSWLYFYITIVQVMFLYQRNEDHVLQLLLRMLQSRLGY